MKRSPAMWCGPQVPAQAVWLTHPRIPIKLERSNRGCPDHREGAAIRFYSSPLGGRPIGRTPDSGSGYPGSSPGLPANLKLAETRSQTENILEHYFL